MRNMNQDDFEQRLQRQPLRPVPGEWREEILAVAGRESRVECRAQESLSLSTLLSRLSALLWPNPRVWAGLAAIWLGILAVNFSLRDRSPVFAEKSVTPSPKVLMVLQQQQRLLAELIGPRETHKAEPPRTFVPRPRGERSLEVYTV